MIIIFDLTKIIKEFLSSVKEPCFVFHDKKELPWFYERSGRVGPTAVCIRCGYCWGYLPYYASYKEGPQYANQPVPAGYADWISYLEHLALTRDKM